MSLFAKFAAFGSTGSHRWWHVQAWLFLCQKELQPSVDSNSARWHQPNRVKFTLMRFCANFSAKEMISMSKELISTWSFWHKFLTNAYVVHSFHSDISPQHTKPHKSKDRPYCAVEVDARNVLLIRGAGVACDALSAHSPPYQTKLMSSGWGFCCLINVSHTAKLLWAKRRRDCYVAQDIIARRFSIDTSKQWQNDGSRSNCYVAWRSASRKPRINSCSCLL